jgi:hypothetical protein
MKNQDIIQWIQQSRSKLVLGDYLETCEHVHKRLSRKQVRLENSVIPNL